MGNEMAMDRYRFGLLARRVCAAIADAVRTHPPAHPMANVGNRRGALDAASGICEARIMPRSLAILTPHARYPGVYAIVCAPAQLVYVGQTSRTMAARWNEHFQLLALG